MSVPPILPWLLAVSIGCDASSRLEPIAPAPNAPDSIDATIDNEPTEWLIDTDLLVDDTDTDEPPPEISDDILSLSAGNDFTCAVYGDGELRCWGDNAGGRADGADGAFVLVAAGTTHACALTSAGGAVCWGDATGGKTSPPVGVYTRLASGANGTCAADAAGEVTCWGAIPAPPGDLPAVGALTLGDTFACGLGTDAADPNRLVCWGTGTAATGAPDTQLRAVTAGASHACGIDTNNELVCWGDATGGKLNAPSGTWASVYAGANQTCAVAQDGNVACWGATVAPPAQTFVGPVAPGTRHVCAARTRTQLSCWGDGTVFQTTPPRRTGVAQVTAGTAHACIIEGSPGGSGPVSCFGASQFDRLAAPVGTFVQIDAGFAHSCGVLTGVGDAVCWGLDNFAQTQVKEADGQTYLQVSAAFRTSCGVRTDGAAECWGASYDAFPPVTGPFTALSTGLGHTLALGEPAGGAAGAAESWGANAAGQRNVPAGQTWIDLTAGDDHSCGITAAGTLQCWGSDASEKASPPAGTFRRVSAGKNHTCAVRTDDAVLCWGLDDAGQLDAPAGAWVDVSVGENFACAVNDDGGLACWGSRRL